MTKQCAAFCAALFLFLTGLAPAVSAQDVTLTSLDGAVEIEGTLRGFDGEFYRLDTVYGEITIDASGVSCDGPGCPNLEAYVAEMRVSGSATMGEVLMPALIEAFALRNDLQALRQVTGPERFTYALRDRESGDTKALFHFHNTNTNEGFADLLADDSDIVMSLREVRPSEVRNAREVGLGDLTGANRSRVLALDAMVPIVSPRNPMAAISPAQLARIFGGGITNWLQLGGPDAPIVLHLRDAQSGIAQSVQDRLMAPARLSLANDITRHATNSDLADAVANDVLGIGIASFSEIGNAKPVLLSGRCGFQLRATRLAIKTEDYPLTAPMFLYLPARRLPKLARDFLTFTRSDTAQIVIRRAGFVDQAPEEVAINAQGDRFANAISAAGSETSLDELKRMVATLGTRARLSTSFRFRAGSALLDAQSRSNVQQLARALEAGKYDTRSVMFVGFSDGDGPASGNRDIAMKRAAAVRDAVIAAAETANFDRVVVETDAFGEALPMACDDTAWGKQANRRVEVWVR
ncbi:phosphate ABC transporter substrate-binding/OmpA family protein [Phaeobacter sp. J2-8]|uniref:substrate-binding domain-containing protein n=1 Tax=Phaeobacter sp. J2-8 TaxID=2931394 RepID=UPI001FD31C51|nr:phosphate ABC transporter substrate-binding/OmpA family protein [Phaeobacter sp. J2-8]MCJ7874297.1 phosphate ABC transporter substrate-binding/OmpA family protein [Phaeobacter sp. J2-8]